MKTLPSTRVGVAMVAVALLLGLLVRVHPDALRAPAWVAYAAAGAFGVAGLCTCALAAGRPHLARWLVCLLLAVATAVPGWVAFGAGARQCTVVTVGFRSGVAAVLCRGAFAAATLALGLMLIGAIRGAMGARRAKG